MGSNESRWGSCSNNELTMCNDYGNRISYGQYVEGFSRPKLRLRSTRRGRTWSRAMKSG
jgi:hypothetical protein